MTIFHQIIFTASTPRPMMPSDITLVFSLVTTIKYKLVQDYFWQMDRSSEPPLDCGATPYLHPKHPGTNPKYTNTRDVYVTLSQPFPS